MPRSSPDTYCLWALLITSFFFSLASCFIIDPKSSNSNQIMKDSRLHHHNASPSSARLLLQYQEETQEETVDSVVVYPSKDGEGEEGDQYDVYDSDDHEDITDKEFYLFKVAPKSKQVPSDFHEGEGGEEHPKSTSAEKSFGGGHMPVSDFLVSSSSSSSHWFSSESLLKSVDDDEFEQIGVFEYGELTNKFLNCNPYRFSRNTCLVDTFTDLAEFEFTFSLLTDYQINKPTVFTSNESILKAYVEDFYFDMDELTGGFNVRYKCLPQKNANPKLVLVTVELSLTVSSTKSFSWLKECLGDTEKKLTSFLRVEYLDEEDGKVYLLSEAKDKIVARENDPTSSFYISLQPPATQIEFKAPQVTVKNIDIASFSIRGAVFGGILTQNEKEILIIYKCLKNGVASFEMILEFPSYDKFEFLWEKKCDVNTAEKSLREHQTTQMMQWEMKRNNDSVIDEESTEGFSDSLASENGNKSPNDDERHNKLGLIKKHTNDEVKKDNIDRVFVGKLTIGSKEGFDDIYSEGRVHAPYDFDYAKLQVAESSLETENAIVLSAREREISFYLTYHDHRDVVDLPINKLSFTVGSPTVAVVTAKASTSSSLVSNGDVMLPGESRVMTARVVCLKKGRTKIMASLTIELIGQIEFGFIKDCVAPRRIQRNFVLTTSLMFKTACFLLVVLVTVIWKFSKNSRNSALQQGSYLKVDKFQPYSTVSQMTKSTGDNRSFLSLVEIGDHIEEGKKD